MPTGRGFTYPIKYGQSKTFDDLAIVNTVNWQYLEAYINHNLPFLGEGVWDFDDPIHADSYHVKNTVDDTIVGSFFGYSAAGRVIALFTAGDESGTDGNESRVQIYGAADTGSPSDLIIYGRNASAQSVEVLRWNKTTDEASLGTTVNSETNIYSGGAVILRGTSIMGNDNSTGEVEIFPKGTLITMGNANSTTDITSIPTSETQASITRQIISCDHANQPVYVQVWTGCQWYHIDDTFFFGHRPGVNDSAVGTLFIDQSDFGHAHTYSNTTGSDTHSHNLNSPNNFTLNPGTGAHALASHTSDQHSHSSSGTTSTSTISGNERWSQNNHWMGTATADGSGNITVGIFIISEDGNADIDRWNLSWCVWRR